MAQSHSQNTGEAFLTSLLNKTLRVTTTDTRMFLGQFKCTDSDRNIILSQTFEYRLPPPPKSITSQKVVLDMTSRYLGLVVVPGEYVVRIEVEEFASQMKGNGKDMGGNASEMYYSRKIGTAAEETDDGR